MTEIDPLGSRRTAAAVVTMLPYVDDCEVAVAQLPMRERLASRAIIVNVQLGGAWPQSEEGDRRISLADCVAFPSLPAA